MAGTIYCSRNMRNAPHNFGQSILKYSTSVSHVISQLKHEPTSIHNDYKSFHQGGRYQKPLLSFDLNN